MALQQHAFLHPSHSITPLSISAQIWRDVVSGRVYHGLSCSAGASVALAYRGAVEMGYIIIILSFFFLPQIVGWMATSGMVISRMLSDWLLVTLLRFGCCGY